MAKLRAPSACALEVEACQKHDPTIINVPGLLCQLLQSIMALMTRLCQIVHVNLCVIDTLGRQVKICRRPFTIVASVGACMSGHRPCVSNVHVISPGGCVAECLPTSCWERACFVLGVCACILSGCYCYVSRAVITCATDRVN